ncbi:MULTISPECIES: SDR family NAD(P)-dependent oxidoreductase [unclassified Arthrobacter]|uniref:SDR family NAD(P)-dependent oxidoreductase n=1 Tax=unclassified Arthrobacter TaxID=235627 RepID=UPI001CFFA9E8|nr:MULTISPECIES: SDR family NAD(P)-dependent oxidoreductase [unclassified Arthrobacter]MCB5283629.1 1-deoxy-11-beta-hydroxypentalenate dehydrogenase [Arthrobacter sp. ES1]WGZ78255.1 SDR family NAD(P)-dependent oxidoreductase [Arthrobacter sp. EM1]
MSASSIPFTVSGGAVLVTGAAMGMGRLYALRAAREGAAVVILWDVDADGLAKTAAEVAALGARAVVREVDLADRAAIADAAEACREEGPLTLLVNNAGIVRGALFWDHSPELDIALTMDINALAPMYVTHAFLPAMMADAGRPRRILNIASAAGTVSNPRMSVYAASKWAVIGWSDSLRLELEQQGFGHLAVTTFCPSYISTGMFEGARGPLLTPLMTPDDAVDRAWRATAAGRPQLIAPAAAQLGKVLRGILPVRAWDFVGGKVFGIYATMDKFTGRGRKTGS